MKTTFSATGLSIKLDGICVLEELSRYQTVRFWRDELLPCLLEAREELLLRIRNQLAKLDQLIIDELGYVRPTNALA